MEKKYTSMKKGIGNGRDKRCALVSGGSSCCALALARSLACFAKCRASSPAICD